MSVPVTGAAGFLASHAADALPALGHEVVGLDDLSGGFRENVSEGIPFYEGSILDTALLLRVFSGRRIQFVFHLAAYSLPVKLKHLEASQWELERNLPRIWNAGKDR